MRIRRLWHYTKYVLLAVLLVCGDPGSVQAVTSNSANYEASQMQFGASDNLENCSGNYCARASIGDMATGDSASSGSTAKFGSVIDSDPVLEVIVDPGQSFLGNLSSETTATKTTTVRVRTHLSSGYTLQIVGNAPKYGKHSLHTPAVPTASQAGVEQFAINAVANTAPSVGASPVQLPSDQTSFGEVDEDYRTPNRFKFISGDTVARSNSESGRTDYTISMIVNISNSTPAGHYSGDFSAVVVPVF